MTSLASREMTEQEMINTCTAPQMAHLIQVLRQKIRQDKEIEKWVDMVKQLQRDGELDPPEPKPLLADAQVGDLCQTRGEGYHLIDIIHTEPLAEVGTAEWAWQMAKLGIETRCYEGKIKVSKSGLIEVCYNGMAYAMPLTQSPDNKAYTIKKISQCSPTGWQLYEEPAPFAVGDVVRHHSSPYDCGVGYIVEIDGNNACVFFVDDMDTEVVSMSELSRCNPSEVIVKIGCLKGTVAHSSSSHFCLCAEDNWTMIAFDMLDTQTRELVKALLAAQEEK